MCICAAAHPLASRDHILPSDLNTEKLVLANPPTASFHSHITGRRPPSDIYFADSLEAVSVLVEAGFGVAILPDYSTPRSPELVAVPIEGMPPLSFGLYYKNPRNNSLLRDFIAVTEENFHASLPSPRASNRLLLP